MAIFLFQLALARREWVTALLTISIGAALALSGGGSGLTNAAICSLAILASAIQCQFAVNHSANSGTEEMVRALLGSTKRYYWTRCGAAMGLIFVPAALVTVAVGTQLEVSISTWAAVVLLNVGASLIGLATGALVHLVFRWSRVLEATAAVFAFFGLLIAPVAPALLRDFADRPGRSGTLVLTIGAAAVMMVGQLQPIWSLLAMRVRRG